MTRPDTERVVVRRLGPADEPALAAFFALVAGDPTASGFHPHPFTAEEAARVAGHRGRDLYLGLFDGSALAGYGMLRGWDAGYAIPSLGIYLAPAGRGRGLAATLMDALHRAAAGNGASQVRLKVYPGNIAAMRLYQRLGYVFSSEEAGQRVGLLALSPGPGTASRGPIDPT
jgi:ribosomal protein S18 acetylase RimI-like enzyme